MAKPPESAPQIATLAEIKDWEIGPTRDCPSALTLTLVIRNWEDVATVTYLASGQVVLRLLPLQIGLPETVGCGHPPAGRLAFDETRAVCMNCGCILDV